MISIRSQFLVLPSLLFENAKKYFAANFETITKWKGDFKKLLNLLS